MEGLANNNYSAGRLRSDTDQNEAGRRTTVRVVRLGNKSPDRYSLIMHYSLNVVRKNCNTKEAEYESAIDCSLGSRIIVVMDLLVCARRGERDYYEVLGVEPNSSADEIRRAYHILAFQCHPDKNCRIEEANKQMQEINEAYAILSDPIKRREYDLPRGYGIRVAKFKKGSKVKIGVNSPSPYRGQAGVVDREPANDAFRFWYMVRIESRGLTTARRFAEEELEGLAS